MTLLLVRHADAGDRIAWTGDDRARPLSATGRRQAEALVAAHRAQPLGRVLCSPARRCIDTVAPLAEARDLPVEEDEALAEGAPFDAVDRLLRSCADRDTLLCSHGDVVGMVVAELRRHGLVGADARWRMAATWLLDTWPDTTHVTHLPPPDVG